MEAGSVAISKPIKTGPQGVDELARVFNLVGRSCWRVGMPQDPSDTTSATFLKGIGDMEGDWIDVIWEPGRTNPNLLTHIQIGEDAEGIRIWGTSYSAKDVRGEGSLDPVGDFESRHVVLLAGRDGFSYQYKGREYRAAGAGKQHSGVGFYEFGKHPTKGHTFEGSFLVHEERVSRHVEGERIRLAKRGELDDSARPLLRKFLNEKRIEPPFALLEDALRRHVGVEFSEFVANYEAKNPFAAAFLLRRMLERLLYLAFDKNNLTDLIRKTPGDENSRLKGLEEIIRIAKGPILNGAPILRGQTAGEIKGAKFLGDMAAHHPLGSVINMMGVHSSVPPAEVAYAELLATLPNP
jgi:hypothetical protein